MQRNWKLISLVFILPLCWSLALGALSQARWEMREAVVQVATSDGAIIEARGAVREVRCQGLNLFGRVCENLEPGDIADFSGEIPASDVDDQRLIVTRIEVYPLFEAPPRPGPPDGDGRGKFGPMICPDGGAPEDGECGP